MEISGVADVRAHYWDSYNSRKDQVLSKELEDMNSNFLESHVFSNEEKEEIKKSLNGNDLQNANVKVSSKQNASADKAPPQADPKVFDVAEEFIVNHIPDEIIVVLQTAVMLQVELGIDCEDIYALYPKVLTVEQMGQKPDIDTSVQSKILLCPAHIDRLSKIIERLGDKASMKTLLEGKPAQASIE